MNQVIGGESPWLTVGLSLPGQLPKVGTDATVLGPETLSSGLS